MDDKFLFKKMEPGPHRCVMFSLGLGKCICNICGRVGKDLSYKRPLPKPVQAAPVSKWLEKR
jgi:hypothetical protein